MQTRNKFGPHDNFLNINSPAVAFQQYPSFSESIEEDSLFRRKCTSGSAVQRCLTHM